MFVASSFMFTVISPPAMPTYRIAGNILGVQISFFSFSVYYQNENLCACMPSKPPFCMVASIVFYEYVTLRYNFTHFFVTIVKSLNTIVLVWYWAVCTQLLVPVLNVSEQS